MSQYWAKLLVFQFHTKSNWPHFNSLFDRFFRPSRRWKHNVPVSVPLRLFAETKTVEFTVPDD